MMYADEVKVGQRYRRDPSGLVYTVHTVTPAGSAGTKESDGPRVGLWLGPGQHGLTIQKNGYPSPEEFTLEESS